MGDGLILVSTLSNVNGARKPQLGWVGTAPQGGVRNRPCCRAHDSRFVATTARHVSRFEICLAPRKGTARPSGSACQVGSRRERIADSSNMTTEVY